MKGKHAHYKENCEHDVKSGSNVPALVQTVVKEGSFDGRCLPNH